MGILAESPEGSSDIATHGVGRQGVKFFAEISPKLTQNPTIFEAEGMLRSISFKYLHIPFYR